MFFLFFWLTIVATALPISVDIILNGDNNIINRSAQQIRETSLVKYVQLKFVAVGEFDKKTRVFVADIIATIYSCVAIAGVVSIVYFGLRLIWKITGH